MTLKMFIKWLEENFPQNATLVKTNSRSWFSNEVERISADDLYDMFFLKENPEMKGKPVKKPCLVVFDEDMVDY